MISSNSKPVRKLLTASLIVFAGAAAYIALSATQASAFVISDQDSTTTNTGVGIANTGGNVAIGNDSSNDASANQKATANGGSGDSVAINDSTATNNSNGSANIVTGDANATGNQAANSTVQVLDAGGANGQFVLADQNNDTTNSGVGISNTGGNVAAGNLSDNTATSNQKAKATASNGDAIAVNSGSATNNSNGSATIITGDASAIGSQSANHAVQVIDASDAGSFVLADQNVNTQNFGLGVANSGLNFGFGNLSQNTNTPTQTATASGNGDQVAANSGVVSNTTNGDALIATGNASGVGSTSITDTSQTLDANGVSRVTDPANATIPLLLLLMFGLLFAATPVRRLGYSRRQG